MRFTNTWKGLRVLMDLVYKATNYTLQPTKCSILMGCPLGLNLKFILIGCTLGLILRFWAFDFQAHLWSTLLPELFWFSVLYIKLIINPDSSLTPLIKVSIFDKKSWIHILTRTYWNIKLVIEYLIISKKSLK